LWRHLCFSIFFSLPLPGHSGPRPFIQFRNHFSQTVGHLGRVISPSQGRYLNTGQQKTQNTCKRIYTPNINALSGIRTQDPSVRASEDSSCLRPRGYCDRPMFQYRDLEIYDGINILKRLKHKSLSKVSGSSKPSEENSWRRPCIFVFPCTKRL
jgi:hypothetical protein